MNKKIGIIFDMDGTILDTLEDLLDNVNYVLHHFSYPLRSLNEVKSFVGNGIKVLMEKAVPKNLNNEQIIQAYELFKTQYTDNLFNKTKPYDGIIELLSTLKQNHVAIAVVSNKFQRGVDALNDIFFRDYIEIAIGTQPQLLPKPSPESVFYAIKLMNLDIKTDEIYYVGDSEVDILTANNAKLPMIAVSWGFRTKEQLLAYSPKYIIDKPQEILKIINLSNKD